MYKKSADFLRTETRSSNCSVFARGKKAISPVVALALLLVVSVTAVVSFQTWYSDFSSQLFSEAEDNSQQTTTKIERVVNDNLYFKIGFSELEISQVNVEGNSCGISGNYTRGVEKLALGNNCTQNLSTTTPQLVVETNRGLYSHQFFKLKSQSLSSSNNGNTNDTTTIGNYTFSMDGSMASTFGVYEASFNETTQVASIENYQGPGDYLVGTPIKTIDWNSNQIRVLGVDQWNASVSDSYANNPSSFVLTNPNTLKYVNVFPVQKGWLAFGGVFGGSNNPIFVSWLGGTLDDIPTLGVDGDGTPYVYRNGKMFPFNKTNSSSWLGSQVTIGSFFQVNNQSEANYSSMRFLSSASSLPSHPSGVVDFNGSALETKQQFDEFCEPSLGSFMGSTSNLAYNQFEVNGNSLTLPYEIQQEEPTLVIARTKYPAPLLNFTSPRAIEFEVDAVPNNYDDMGQIIFGLKDLNALGNDQFTLTYNSGEGVSGWEEGWNYRYDSYENLTGGSYTTDPEIRVGLYVNRSGDVGVVLNDTDAGIVEQDLYTTRIHTYIQPVIQVFSYENATSDLDMSVYTKSENMQLTYPAGTRDWCGNTLS